MASDLKMEIFAYKQFYVLSLNHSRISPMKSVLQVYEDECTKVENYSECCDDVYDKAIKCRMVLFITVYINSIDRNDVLRWESLSDFHDFVNRLCDRDDLFGHLTIFEKIFSTLASLISYCLFDYQKGRVDVLNYIHIMWATYFDKFIDEFYKEGGWNELRQVAETYIAVYNLFQLDDQKILDGNYITSLKEATINYCQFQNAINHYYWNYQHKGEIHISILWVKLRTKYFEERIIVPSMLLNHNDCFEIEILLQNLKRLCNFSQNYYRRVEILREKYKKSVWNFEGCRKPPKNLFSPSDSCFGNQNLEHDLCTAKHDLCTVKQTEEQDLCFGNLVEERSDLTKGFESPLHTSFGKENESVYNDNAEMTDVLSTYQTSTDCCNKKKILNSACAAKVDVTNNSEEKIINHNQMDKLRKEQKDPEIRKLLRMILILGDTQGNHCVHREVSGNEESREISQIKLSKRKKRSKK